MKAMLLTDLITARSYLVQQGLLFAAVAVFVTVAMGGGAVMASAMYVAMLPLLYLFSIASYDELNGWERFRMALPLSRRDIVLGRYASLLVVFALCIAAGTVLAGVITAATSLPLPAPIAERLGSESSLEALVAGPALATALVMTVCAASLPLIMRQGLTKAVRVVLIALVLGIAGVAALMQDTPVGEAAETLVDGLLSSAPSAIALMCALVGASLVLYGISAAVSVKLYERREL